MKEFFFDTADLEFIKKTIEKLEGKIDFKLIKGVTTNPNAFNKIDKHSMYQWVEVAEEIGNFLYDLRQDSKGEVHIQLPNANLKIDHAVKFSDFISQLPNSKMTIGMKIPPYQEILTNLEKLLLRNSFKPIEKLNELGYTITFDEILEDLNKTSSFFSLLIFSLT